MNDDTPPPTAHAEDAIALPPTSVAKPSPASVTDCGLRLSSVRLTMVVCVPGDQGGDPSMEAEMDCDASLVEGSLEEAEYRGFAATVRWSTKFPEEAPVKISGVHRLAFSVTRPINSDDAEYYSQINSVILLYPYLRQLVDELSAKSLGRSVMTRPLDVVQHVLVREREWRNQTPETPDDDEGGAEALGNDATG